MKRIINEMKLRLPARSANEAIARSIISAFVAELSPTVEELGDIRCAVSEAVTNCIVHAYRGEVGIIELTLRRYEGGELVIIVKDRGVGIENVKEAREPLFTTDTTGERSGMGFAIMESMMDTLTVRSKPGVGTTVTMRIRVGT